MSPAPKPQRPEATSSMHTARTLNPEVETLTTGGKKPAPAARSESAAADPVPFGSYLPADLKRSFKAQCVQDDMEMQDGLAEAIRDWLTKKQAS